MSFLSKIIPNTGIKVAFIDNDGKKVSGITVEQANKVAANNPGKKFYFQNGDGLEQELTIDQVNELSPTDLLPTAPDCPTGPQVCGPPLVRFFGGQGTGASANAIISPISSSIIAFDIVNPGFGFFGSPSAELIDPCGKGSGSKLQVNMEEDNENTTGLSDVTGRSNLNLTDQNGNPISGTSTTGTGTGGTGTGTGGTGTGTGTVDPCQSSRNTFEKSVLRSISRSKRIKNITILSPGDGYLSVPDGSLGGNERVWKEPDEGYVKTKCGGSFVVQPYKPIKVEKGDTYYPPDGPPRLIENDEIITLPLVPITPPTPENVGPTYPIILIIDEIKVLDPGFGYRPGDRLIISPDKGSSAELIVNDNGGVEKVIVTNPGVGFLDLPKLRTNSPTGFNAIFSPILRPIRIDINRPVGEQIQKELGIQAPDQIELISVIDCVGRVS